MQLKTCKSNNIVCWCTGLCWTLKMASTVNETENSRLSLRPEASNCNKRSWFIRFYITCYVFSFIFFNRYSKGHNKLLSAWSLIEKHVFINFTNLSWIQRLIYADHWTRLINHFDLLRYVPEHAIFCKVVLSYKHIYITLLLLPTFYKQDGCRYPRLSYCLKFFFVLREINTNRRK